ncbi:hypothetical protein SPRG_06285 [Saprolegnia parasitica CBS 223.65]|uniref:Expansin-like EG45 domain-containing protein n=1 Tax=Saprolegnia parasitica (strain CBS 223.65) TaxID=695850 RepID=A0A067CNZ6_SAPPC|nr:hypothetical protein SPRG_06285 [Saprolegnia parasitica CBS 223.65]KDO28236.1 hypothetical protein SPRG_06285 [Saprolegnia parasitica CBS 223.65]|eukprot:XP_012201060.1 hypothetical protein SPRG_06285 [Saprolegnia parasitica CBS 223.65]
MLYHSTVLLVALGIASTAAQSFAGKGTSYEASSVGAGNCNLMSWLPIANTNRVAIPSALWASGANCGRCVQIQCVDRLCESNLPVVAQITDSCPTCGPRDVDMLDSLFQKVTGGLLTGAPQIVWAFVPCAPVGGVHICTKVGSSRYWLALQPSNTISGVQSLRVMKQPTSLLGSAFYFVALGQASSEVSLASTEIELTSFGGDVISATVSLAPNTCTRIQAFKN